MTQRHVGGLCGVHIVAHHGRDLDDRAKVEHQLMNGMHAALEQHAAGIPGWVAAPVSGFDLQPAVVGGGLLEGGYGAQFAGINHLLDADRHGIV